MRRRWAALLLLGFAKAFVARRLLLLAPEAALALPPPEEGSCVGCLGVMDDLLARCTGGLQDLKGCVASQDDRPEARCRRLAVEWRVWRSSSLPGNCRSPRAIRRRKGNRGLRSVRWTWRASPGGSEEPPWRCGASFWKL